MKQGVDFFGIIPTCALTTSKVKLLTNMGHVDYLRSMNLSGDMW